ncbi:MAG TPA: hypothetical protein VHK70_00255 [Burkholderiaceae bacterium]|nr:hypothetical protein [Burkholderiaceae bacterium]
MLLVLWYGPEIAVSRWSPITLAFTHLLTLGVLAMTMIGALMQILPVVTGVSVPRAPAVAAIVHALLTSGTVALATGFIFSMPVFFQIAVPLLALAFACLLGAIGYGLWRAPASSNVTLKAVRLALASLLAAITLGVVLGSSFAWQISLPLIKLTNLHVLWGLLGWIGLLVIGVAFQVVPMFQVTPVYPHRVTRWLPGSLFVLLLLWSAITLVSDQVSNWPTTAIFGLIVAGFVVFSLATLRLLWRKKRQAKDTTELFWRTSMGSLLLCAGLWGVNAVAPGVVASDTYPLTMGVLFMAGFAYSAINGMLYKIAPFLTWYHLQITIPAGSVKIPNAKRILPDEATRKQFYAHLIALALMVAASLWPMPLVYMAAGAFAVSSCWLWLNLLQTARLYYRFMRNEQARHTAANPG